MCIAEQITAKKKLEDLKKAYKDMDQNNDNKIAQEELEAVYMKILNNSDKAHEEAGKLVKELDYGDKGYLEFPGILRIRY